MRDFREDHSALALNTASLGHNLDGAGAGWSPEQLIDACAARGFGGITYWRRELGSRAAEIGARTRAAGLAVVGLCRTPLMVGPGTPALLQDEVKAAIDTAAALGAPVLTIVTGGTEPGSLGLAKSWDLLAERVALACDYAAAQGVKLALEPLNPMFGGNRSCLFSVADAHEICRRVDHAALGIAVDVYHVWWDSRLAESLAAAKGLILGYHLCDWLAETRHMLLDRGMMGDGVADLRAIRGAVEAAGYDGFCEVEIFSAEDWWRRDPGDVLDVMVQRFRTCC